MATVNKDFRVKAGLVVEGSTATVDGKNIITAGVVNDKGDLIVGSADDAVARLGVGSNGQVLTAASGATYGVEWANPAAVGVFESSITFEGATADAYETTLEVTDPTADRTITFPDATGTVALTSDLNGYVTETGTQTLTNKTIDDPILKDYVSFTDNSDIERMSIDYSGTGTTRIISQDDLSIRSQDGDIILYPGSNNQWGGDGGDGKVYINWGNDATDAAPENEVATHGYVDTAIGNIDLTYTTDDVTEGATNKYYSDTLVDNHLSGGDGISYSSGTISADVAGGLHIDNAQVQIDRTTVDGWYEASGTVSTHASETSTHGVSGNIVGTSDTQTLSNKTVSDSLHFQDGVNNYSAIYANADDLKIDGSDDIVLTTNTGDIILNPDGHAYIGSATAENEIATHSYVDNAVSGLSWKQAVNLKISNNINVSGDQVGAVFDGHTALTTADTGYRFLLTDQNTGSENGIWESYVDGATLLLRRPTDADVYSELIGAAVYVMEGTQFGSTSWVQGNHYLTNFTGQDWTQFSGQGSVTAGDGITVDGLEVSIDRTTVDGWYEASGAVSTHSDLTTGVHGVSGNVVGTTDTQDLSNKKITDTLYFQDGATLGNEGEIAIRSVSHDFDVQANYGDLHLKSVATGGDVLLTADDGDIVLDAAGTAYYGTATANNEIATIGNLQDGDSTATPQYTGIELPDALIGSATEIAGTSATTIDTWSATTYSAAKYIVQMKQGTDIEVIEMLVAVDGSNNVYVTEYANVISNAELGTTNAVYNSGNVLLQVTGAAANTVVKVSKTYIEA